MVGAAVRPFHATEKVVTTRSPVGVAEKPEPSAFTEPTTVPVPSSPTNATVSASTQATSATCPG